MTTKWDVVRSEIMSGWEWQKLHKFKKLRKLRKLLRLLKVTQVRGKLFVKLLVIWDQKKGCGSKFDKFDKFDKLWGGES